LIKQRNSGFLNLPINDPSLDNSRFGDKREMMYV